MQVKHFFISKISHSSYILAGSKSCAVIDPQRYVDDYIIAARDMGVEITHILQTHLHADFISGHMDLAKKTGAKIYVPKSANCTFDHVPLSEGDTIELEDMLISVLETPGHTPEHISYVVTDKSRGDNPVCVFPGDTLFVGDVGRPDLFPNIAEELAGKLYHSLFDKLLQLPDFCEVYPAHGAGSLCGRAIGAKWFSTIGYERRFNQAIQLADKSEFIKSLTTNMPPAPDHFSRCSDINRKGPTLISDLPPISELNPADFMDCMNKPNTTILDMSSYLSFGSLHIPKSLHIDLNGNFPTFAGWIIPVDNNILIISNEFHKSTTASAWLRRVGLDNITGFLDRGMMSWAISGNKTDSVRQISAEELHEMVTGSSNFVLLDVRAPMEYTDSHIEGAINIPVADLRTRHAELDKNKTTILVCSSGNRSSLGTSILKQHGFRNLYNVAGGMTGYSKAGYAKQCHVCVNPHGSRFFSEYREIRKHSNKLD